MNMNALTLPFAAVGEIRGGGPLVEAMKRTSDCKSLIQNTLDSDEVDKSQSQSQSQSQKQRG